jgi:hypothetical protein
LGTHEAPVRCVEYSHATGKIKKKTYALTIGQEIARFSHMIQFYHTNTNLVSLSGYRDSNFAHTCSYNESCVLELVYDLSISL